MFTQPPAGDLLGVLGHAGVSLTQFQGDGHLTDEADDEPIVGAAADGFETEAEQNFHRYLPLARFVARRMRLRRITIPYIIEMGPGPGLWALAAAREMPTAVIDGFDLSQDMVRKANARYARADLGPRVQAFHQDMRGVHRVHAGKADLVFSRNMLHRLADLRPALSAMLFAAKPQGEVFVTCFLRIAGQTPEGRRRFLASVAARAAFPALQHAYVIAHLFAHSLADYQRAAREAASFAHADLRLWTGADNEIYLHFQKR